MCSEPSELDSCLLPLFNYASPVSHIFSSLVRTITLYVETSSANNLVGNSSMTDKKIDDYVGRLGNDENDAFLGKPLPPSRSQSPLLSLHKIDNSPGLSILAYCFSSISMTVVNKYVVSGTYWNLNFFYLAIQAIVCIMTIVACKQIGLIKNLKPFDSDKAKKCVLLPI